MNPKDPFLRQWQEHQIRESAVLQSFDEYRAASAQYDSFLCSYFSMSRVAQALSIGQLLRRFERYAATVRDTLAEIAPAAIVSTSEASRAALIANRWAVQNCVPFVVVQPTLIDPSPRSWPVRIRRRVLTCTVNRLLSAPFVPPEAPFGKIVRSNTVCVWGDEAARTYPDREAVFITGNPVFDDVESASGGRMHRPVRGKPVIGICTEALPELASPETMRAIDAAYADVMAANPSWDFLIKVHPREPAERYAHLASARAGGGVCLVTDGDIRRFCERIDVQMSVNSYSSVEAIVFGVPVVLLSHPAMTLSQYLADAPVLHGDRSEELSRHVSRCLSDQYRIGFSESRARYIKRQFGVLDGRASERVVSVIGRAVERAAQLDEPVRPLGRGASPAIRTSSVR